MTFSSTPLEEALMLQYVEMLVYNMFCFALLAEQMVKHTVYLGLNHCGVLTLLFCVALC